MKKIPFLIFISATFFLMCSKPNPDPNPVFNYPLLDFTSSKYFKPSEIKASRVNLPCGGVSYWEGKKINLTGFSSGVNLVDTIPYHRFMINETFDVRTDISILIQYNGSDVQKINSLLSKNPNKSCYMTVTCGSDSVPLQSCLKSISFKLLKVEDIEFQ